MQVRVHLWLVRKMSLWLARKRAGFSLIPSWLRSKPESYTSTQSIPKGKSLLEQLTNSALVEKLICFELNIENECQRKVISKQASPSFSLGKMSKGHADIYIFFSLSTLFPNKNLPKPTGCHFLMEICFDKNFPTSFMSYAQTFPLSIPAWICRRGRGWWLERGSAFWYPPVMYHPAPRPTAVRNITASDALGPRLTPFGWLASLGGIAAPP